MFLCLGAGWWAPWRPSAAICHHGPCALPVEPTKLYEFLHKRRNCHQRHFIAPVACIVLSYIIQGRSVITMHIQKLYFLSQHEKTPFLMCRTNGQIVFYTKSPMTSVFCYAMFVVLCFIFRHEVCFVFYFISGLRFSFCF